MPALRCCLDCGEPAEHARCPHCAAVNEQRRDQQRPHTRARGYTNQWEQVAARAKHQQPWCTDCGATADLTVDHALPLARGGTSTPTNARVLCRSCNSRKGARP